MNNFKSNHLLIITGIHNLHNCALTASLEKLCKLLQLSCTQMMQYIQVSGKNNQRDNWMVKLDL